MITLGTYKNHTLANGWTVVTRDRKLSAHYENTVVITPNGVDILTEA
jgi:methionyl aminopeptidase